MAKATTKNAPASIVNMAAWVKKAKERPVVLPKLQFVRDKEIVLKEAIVRFEDAEPHNVPIPVEKRLRKDVTEMPVITITDEADNTRKTLTLASDGLQVGVAAIYANAGTLKGQRAKIVCEHYQHKSFGKTVGYRVTHLDSEETPEEPETS